MSVLAVNPVRIEGMPIPEETVPSSIASAASPAHGETTTDSGLRCPVCEYNLTGVAEDRCPECGKPFDRADLLADLAWGPRPLPIWDDPGRGALARIAGMYWVTWFRPAWLGRTAPRFLDKKRIARFRSVALVVSLVAVLLVIMLDAPQKRASLALGVAAGVVGMLICETILGIVFVVALTAPDAERLPPLKPGTTERQWGLVGLFRTYTTASVAALSVPVWVRGSESTVIWCWLAVAIWWWVALSAFVWVQPATLRGKLVCIVAIPLAAAVSAPLSALTLLPLVVLSGG
ncbi:MAG: hypothetical protein HS113_30935 [Verrucomicrobiales bacterium]|nr:hypothetical protein [Verrucomicrobiales bacterium]